MGPGEVYSSVRGYLGIIPIPFWGGGKTYFSASSKENYDNRIEVSSGPKKVDA